MSSFIFTLSLLVLVLATGCFTLPVIDEEFSSTIFPSFHDHSSTGKAILGDPKPFDIRLISEDGKNDLPKFPLEGELKHHFEFESSTPVDNQELHEKFTQSLRSFNDSPDFESHTVTTQSSDSKVERNSDDFSFTEESSTQFTEHHLRSLLPQDDKESNSENLSERDLQVELTTNYMPSFTSTSSVVAPQLYTTESSTSTKKYTGFLNDGKDEEFKPKVSKTQGRKENNSDDLNFPTAQLDQKALDGVSNLPNDFMKIEENTDVVTHRPGRSSTTTIENKKESEYKSDKIPLNQGKESSFTKEKESNH